MDCRSPRSMEFSGKNTGVGRYSLLQGIFPIQGLNPCLPHCKWILYHLSHQGSPRILEWMAYSFSRGSSWPRDQMGVSCIAGGFLPVELPGKPIEGKVAEIGEETVKWQKKISLNLRTSYVKSSSYSRQDWEDKGQFSSVQSLSHVWLFTTPWTTARQASLSVTNSQSSPKPMSIVSVMPSNHHPLSSPSPPALNLSQHQGLFKWVGSSHQVAKI